MPDPFSALPMPLPLMIFDAIEDFYTLSNLLQSSPAANVIFEGFYGHIAEAALSNLTPQLQRLLRTIVHIRSDHLNIGGKLTSSEALDSFLSARVLNDVAGDEPLSNATVSLAAVRSLTKSANRVQQSASSFFEELLDRVNSIKPPYLPDNSYDFNDFRVSLSEKNNRVKLPEGCRYNPIECGAASWIEEQRVCRALWRLQLYFDLVTIVRPRPGATSLAWNLLNSLGPHRVWGKLKRRWELGEIDCVYDFLCECVGATRMPPAHRSHLIELPTTNPKVLMAPRSMPYRDHDLWRRTDPNENIDRPSPGASKIRALRHVFWPPLQSSLFKPSQRLGFYVWDWERMVGLGLIKVQDADKYLAPVRDVWSEFDFYFRGKGLVVEDSKIDTGEYDDPPSI